MLARLEKQCLKRRPRGNRGSFQSKQLELCTNQVQAAVTPQTPSLRANLPHHPPPRTRSQMVNVGNASGRMDSRGGPGKLWPGRVPIFRNYPRNTRPGEVSISLCWLRKIRPSEVPVVRRGLKNVRPGKVPMFRRGSELLGSALLVDFLVGGPEAWFRHYLLSLNTTGRTVLD